VAANKSDIHESAEPDAGALFESLRAFGYSPETAIADLIDNSITAGASIIGIKFFWDGPDSYVSIYDDGHGMTATDLRQAMRPGSKHPDEERDINDLGRFGLGLKTASLSQGRVLTVASKTVDSPVAVRRWDLEYVNETAGWNLLISPSELSAPLVSLLDEVDSGTLVVWENLDRLVGDAVANDAVAQRSFLQIASRVEEHLSMVFHRFLSGPGKIEIRINGNPIDPWDPFLRNEDPTQILGDETLYLREKGVDVTPYVLPHHGRLAADVHERAAGPRGWNAHQGFYVYRNRRLLVSGDWLGLGLKQEEHSKLARIQVDIPNAMDGDWAIDVRKSRARPPSSLRDDFRRLARVTRGRATEVYRHRGKTAARATAQEHVYLWKKKFRGGMYSYVIDRDHPLVKRAIGAEGQDKASLNALLRQIEETIPYQQIWVDNAERPDSNKSPYAGSRDTEILDILEEIYLSLIDSGAHHSEAIERLRSMDPFDERPELIELLAERLGN
jgi:hypothetical protein